MSIEELKQKFDAACTELANDAQTVVETHFFITAYMKMFGEYPNIISLDTEGFYLNPKGNEDADDEEGTNDEDKSNKKKSKTQNKAAESNENKKMDNPSPTPSEGSGTQGNEQIEGQEQPETQEQEENITGPTFIKPKREYEFTYVGNKVGEWSVEKDVPVSLEQNGKTVKLRWHDTYSGQFDLYYAKVFKKTIVVESLF